MTRDSSFQNPFSRRDNALSGDRVGVAKALLGEGGRRMAQELLRPKQVLTLAGEGSGFRLTEQESQEMSEQDLKPHEFYLAGVEKLQGLPGCEVLKSNFRFDSIDATYFNSVIPEGRLLWTDDALDNAHIVNPRIRELLSRFSRTEMRSMPVARIVSMNELFPNGFDWEQETIEQVFETIDIAGYRPANYEELLAFAEHYWTPNEGEGDPLHFDAQKVIALGSVYRRPDEYYDSPQLWFSFGRRRSLFAHITRLPIEQGDCLLLIRK